MHIETISGFKIRPQDGIEPLAPVLRNWIVCVEEYCEKIEGDTCYWYTEKANVSVLLGAAWRSGFASLSEYGYSKRSKKTESNFDRSGFNDLFIGNSEISYYFEFKDGDFSINTRSANLQSRIDNKIQEATNDAKLISSKRRSLDRDSGEYVVSGCFIRLFYTKKRSEFIKRDMIDANLTELSRELSKIDNHSIAWCFPYASRNSKAGDGCIVPGTVLALNNYTLS